MRWERGRRSENVEDRRGIGIGRGSAIGGGGLLVLVVVTMLLGGNPEDVLRVVTGAQTNVSTESGPQLSEDPDPQAQFVSVVLADTEDTWDQLFASAGRQYRHPKLVLFSDQVSSACGFASAAVGPFYCANDERVYIDLAFYNDLRTRFGADGDFAQAYVIAHEVGHHVQNLLGIMEQVHQQLARLPESEASVVSVRLELQADCFAGVWGHHANTQRKLLEEGDVEEGLNAAAAIGDDRIQRMSRGRVAPEQWTHGSSAQRVRWFRRGLDTGRIDNCNTFEASSL